MNNIMKKANQKKNDNNFNDRNNNSKYNYNIKFNSFIKFVNDKNLIIKNIKKNKEIILNENIFYSICIKGNNFQAQNDFLNKFNKSDLKEKNPFGFYLKYDSFGKNNYLLTINYEEKNNINKINKDEENLLKKYSISEILEDKIISFNFIDYFFYVFSDLYIIFIHNYKENLDILSKIKYEDKEKYMIIHSNYKKFEENEFQKFTKNNSYYFIDEKNICHYIYYPNNNKKNEELFNLIKSKIESKINIKKDYNFMNEFYTLFEYYINQMFENISLIKDEKDKDNIKIYFKSEPKKKCISSGLIFPPEKQKIKYLYYIKKNEKKNEDKIYFFIEGDLRVNKFNGNISENSTHNIISLKIKYDDKEKKNAFFSNKDDKEKEEKILIVLDNVIIFNGQIKKDKNKLESKNGILSFESNITMDLNENLKSFTLENFID